jgi:hypothetical protein
LIKKKQKIKASPHPAFGHLLQKRREMEAALKESYEFSWRSFAPAASKAGPLNAIKRRLIKYI